MVCMKLGLLIFTILVSCESLPTEQGSSKIGILKVDVEVVAAERQRANFVPRCADVPDGKAYLLSYGHDRFIHLHGAKLDLDVIFLNSKMEIVELKYLRKAQSGIDDQGITSSKEIGYALIAKSGTIGKSGIKMGDKVTIEADFQTEPMPAVKVKGKEIFVELANTIETKNRGLMHRSKISKNNGMLFVFTKPEKRYIWMKNTAMNLSIAYIKSDGTISEIMDRKAYDLTSIGSKDEVQFVLEMNQGWFKDNEIKAGDTFEILDDLKKLPSSASIGDKVFELVVFSKESERSSNVGHLNELIDGLAYLVCYPHERFIHVFGAKSDFDILFLNSKWEIVEIQQLKKTLFRDLREDKGVTCAKEASFAIFVLKDTASKCKLKTGDKVTLSDEIKNQKVEPMQTLIVKDKKVNIELVYTYEARGRGLMHRPKMSKNDGMLFVYPEAGTRSFYMRNTHIPLSIAYIKSDGTISEIVDLKPFDENSHPSKELVQFVLEMNKGWFADNGIKAGDKIDITDQIKKLPSER